VRLALTTSKDITDAIMNDPQRAPRIALIDLRYWQYRPDGSMWAPRGDQNRAFRELTTVQFGAQSDTPPPTTPLLAYRQVREYHDRFPDRALMSWHNGLDAIPTLMAGGAQVIMRYRAFEQKGSDIPDLTHFNAFVRDELASVLMTMEPRDGWIEEPDRNWCLADRNGRHVLIYSLTGPDFKVQHPLAQPERLAQWVDPRTGATTPAQPVRGLPGELITKPDTRAWLLWLKPKSGDVGLRSSN
jgi:hypothetical protein